MFKKNDFIRCKVLQFLLACQLIPINCDYFCLPSEYKKMTYRLIGNYHGREFHHQCPHCFKPETALHFITKCPHFAEQRQTVLDQIEQHYMPRFKSLSFSRQFEILVEGFEPDNPEMKKINSKIQRITQTFILQTKRFLSKPSVPLPPHH